MFSRYFHDIEIAIESLLSNKLKSILTALGIIFGTAAVISMLAIGNGAQQEILEQIKMVGVNNIVITPTMDLTGNGESDASDNGSENGNGEKMKKKFSPGLTLNDLEAIKNIVPSVKKITPEIIANSFVVQNGRRVAAKVIGVNNDYFDVYNMNLEKGNFFSEFQTENGIPVCVIGANISAKIFSDTDPVNQYLKFGHVWLKVIGVFEKSNINLSAADNAGVNLVNDNVYIPVQTMLLRYKNRALINSKSLSGGSGFSGGFFFTFSGSSEKSSSSNYNQLDKIIVQVEETNQLTITTEILSRMLLRRHMNVKDYEITVPELLLKQQQRTKDVFNIVLGAIASISLVVGGIGIMNIMFATVMERIKEIGIRLALGAKKADIIAQFLSEAILISVSGGIIGVFFGVLFSKLITKFADILTIISPGSIIVAFGVSVMIGIIFGISPAKKAAEKDPIESLRHE